MGKLITYLGPADPDDPTTVYIVTADDPDDEDLRLSVGQPQEVTQAQAKALLETEGHDFVVGKPKTGADAPFDKYDDLTADEVIERIGNPAIVPTAGVAEAVVAYEKANEARKSVVEAAEHQAEAYAAGEPQADAESASDEAGNTAGGKG